MQRLAGWPLVFKEMKGGNMPKKKKAVVVTTEFRGVFFGYLEKEDGNSVTRLGSLLPSLDG